MPKILCKAYIDFEVQEAGRAIARSLCERLVALSGDVEAWILYALFEEEAISLLRTDREEEDEEDEEKEVEMVPGKPALVRQVFGRGYKNLKRKNRRVRYILIRELFNVLLTLDIFLLLLACCPAGSVEEFRAEERFAGGGGRINADRHQETGQMVEGLSTHLLALSPVSCITYLSNSSMQALHKLKWCVLCQCTFIFRGAHILFILLHYST